MQASAALITAAVAGSAYLVLTTVRATTPRPIPRHRFGRLSPYPTRWAAHAAYSLSSLSLCMKLRPLYRFRQVPSCWLTLGVHRPVVAPCHEQSKYYSGVIAPMRGRDRAFNELRLFLA